MMYNATEKVNCVIIKIEPLHESDGNWHSGFEIPIRRENIENGVNLIIKALEECHTSYKNIYPLNFRFQSADSVLDGTNQEEITEYLRNKIKVQEEIRQNIKKRGTWH